MRAGGSRRVAFPLVSCAPRGRRQGQYLDVGGLGHALTGYPLIFLAVASAVLLQRPGDRDAWVMALAFGGLIAGAPLLLFEPQMPPPLRRFMVPVWAFLISTMATALFYFFAVFPAASPIDRRVPWLKRVLGVRGARCRHDTRRRVLRRPATAAGSGGSPSTCRTRRSPGCCRATASAACCWRWRRWSGNAFGDLETRRKTRVILAGAVCGFGPITVLQIVLASRGRERA